MSVNLDIQSREASASPYNLDGSVQFPKVVEEPLSVSLSGLQHRYRSGPIVLDDVSFHLPFRSVIRLSGHNGSGKSTLAKILVGAELPTSGTVKISMLNGKADVHHNRAVFWNAPGSLFSYSFQNPDSQLFFSTVEEEIVRSAFRIGRTRVLSEELVHSALQAFGLSTLTRTHPQDLPYVLRKRVALAATFACGTQWMILDEPTLGQDDTALTHLSLLIHSALGRNVGVILITHSDLLIARLGAPLTTITLQSKTTAHKEKAHV